MKKNILILFTLAVIFFSCLELGGGSDTIVRECANPSKTRKAILFLRQSGATVDDSYQVSVMDYSKIFDTTEVGNTFTVDGDHGKVKMNSGSIDFTWFGNDSFQIGYDSTLRTFLQKANVDGVAIRYKVR